MVAAERPQHHRVRDRIGNHLTENRGDDDLSSVGGGRDPSGLVDRQPDRVGVGPHHLPAMEAHADPELDTFRPVMSGERHLSIDCRFQAFSNRREGDKEAVATRRMLCAPVDGDRSTNQAAMGLQHVGVRRSQGSQQHRRTLDVGEQHCSQLAGHRRHLVILPPISWSVSR